MSDLGAIDEDVPFDFGAADSLISLCTSASSLINTQQASRARWVHAASTDFRGYFSDLFGSNATVASGDAQLLAQRLSEVASGVRQLRDEASKEQKRRQTARAWKHHLETRNLWDYVHDWVVGEGAPPVGPPASQVHIQVAPAPARPRQTPGPGSGGGSSGTSSARPESLQEFARSSATANDTLNPWSSTLRNSYRDFAARSHWGRISADGVWTGFDKYLASNAEDVRWATTIAAAFAAAGGSGGVSTLSNAALTAALKAAHVNASRDPLAIEPPEAYGCPPTTGYADDPVNTLTGNFIEVESDLAFSGGASALGFGRTYNSCNPTIGAFGPGWSSWTETALVLADDAARWVLPDGRQLVFPRMGESWDRSTSENYWLTRSASGLTITSSDAGRWEFTPAGRLTALDHGDGTRVRLSYDGQRLVGMSHERNRSIRLEWSGDLVTAAQASDGRRVEYRYDDAARLTAAIGPQGTRHYQWNDAGLIHAVVDADGVIEAENDYDQDARVIRQRSPFGRVTRYAYLPGRVTVVSDEDGSRSNTWISDERGRLVGVIDSADQRQSMAYDRQGNAVQVTERDGAVTLHEYDERGHKTHTRLASGADLQWAYDDCDRVTTVITEAGAVTEYRYIGDSRNPSQLIDPTGGVTAMEWANGLLVQITDPTGVVVRFTYDAHGDLVATTDADGNAARLERDDAGRVVAAVTPLGHRTTYMYNPDGTLASVKDPVGGVWRYQYTVAGRLTARIDPTGARTDIEYGAHGEETKTIDPLGRAIGRRFDDLGNLAASVLPDGSTWEFTHDALSRLVATTNPAGATWSAEYDPNGRPTATVDPSGVRLSAQTDVASGTVSADDGTASIGLGFDRLGRPTSLQAPDSSAAMASYDACGRPIELLDGDGGLTRLVRDAAGRVVEHISPAGITTAYRYDRCGRLAEVTDGCGASTTYSYDADRRLTRITSPTGEAIKISYDAAGRVLSRDVPGKGVARYTYDPAGRIVRSYDTWNGHRRFVYDAAGQLIEAINGNGGASQYVHDLLGRVISITNPDGGRTVYQWDSAGRLISEIDPLGRETRAGYDPAGRQLWQEDPTGTRTEWSYDSAGRQASIRVDGRLISSITRDLRNRSVRIEDHTDPSTPMVHELEWDRRQNLIRRSIGGRETRWSYDADGRRTSLTGPDGGSVSYAYDQAGHLTSVVRADGSRAVLGRDRAGRLIEAAVEGMIQTWTWTEGWLTGHAVTDSDGARRTEIRRDADGHISEVATDNSTTEYAYDQAGQLIAATQADRSWTWAFDASGRMVTETAPGQRTVRTYDAASQLVTSTTNNRLTRYSYDKAGRRVTQVNPDGSRRTFSWGATGWLAGFTDHSIDQTRSVRLHVDANGELARIDDTAITWDTTGELIQTGDTSIIGLPGLTGIGNHWAASGWRPARSTSTNPWQATTATSTVENAVAISATGGLQIADLEWLGARVLDPASHNFLSTDPILPTIASGWASNPYSYAGNNPLGLLDPTGLHPLTDADLQTYTSSHQGALAATGDWLKNNWEYVAGGAMVVAGGVLIATGVGGPAGMMLISAGADTIIQKATTGKVDWGEVAISGALGGFAGAGAAAKLGFTGLKATVAAGVISGGAGGAASGAYGYATGPGPHTVQGFVGATAVNAALGGLTGGAGAAAGHGLATVGGKLLSKTGQELQTLYHGDARGPEIIFSEGLQPRGTSSDLYDYVAHNRPSNFVSTSKSLSLAKDFTAKPPTRTGWVYEIEQPGGIDVNATLGSRSPFRYEREVAFPGGIEASSITRARPAKWGQWTGDWIDNPGAHG